MSQSCSDVNSVSLTFCMTMSSMLRYEVTQKESHGITEYIVHFLVYIVHFLVYIVNFLVYMVVPYLVGAFSRANSPDASKTTSNTLEIMEAIV